MNVLLLPIQLILSFFLVFSISRVYLRFKEGIINLGNFLFWIGIWVLAIFSIFNPSSTNYWAELLGVGRGADMLIYVSIALIFYLIFRTNVMIENLREEISKVVREVALKEDSSLKKSRQNKKRKKKN